MRESDDETKLDQVHEALETSLDSTDSPPLEIFISDFLESILWWPDL